MTAITRHTIFQTSLMSALLDGVYDDDMTVAELLGHGSFGIGTFNALDGEMVVLGGVAYQLRGDGSVTTPPLDAQSPYAVVTNFVPSLSSPLPADSSRAEVAAFIDSLAASPNYMYALRITGRFSRLTTRTVVRQEKPYRPMTEATDEDAVVTFDDVVGTVVGFRTPLYEQGIGVPGCHAHFVDDARTRGGHLLDFTLAEGTVELCVCTDLQLRLPLTRAFGEANLSPDDLAAQIEKTETRSAG
ncbi:acetolactate decarboxylase [Microbacterium sp. W1N]|uniref:acetolactate decarboxylase n=1 Tax=Microbacterium festucae TaxID=2977531 RepID=UPI0021BEBAD4|nr:acetolactate decarboxylase [Microbacterium festucae]MCT9821183.1 acetolactate decarboxylase [Microbacterium festucae]